MTILHKSILSLAFSISVASAQTIGLLEDFNDNILTGWEVPQTTGTFMLTEVDSVLRIDYNRTGQSWEWDNFNFTPPTIINATENPYITVKAKSNIGTILTFKPIYENGDDDWLQVTLPSDDIWHNYNFELIASKPYQINRIYMYLDGGSNELKSGVVFFDDMRIGDSVRTVDVLDLTQLERLIVDANNLHDYSIEGLSEGEFKSGSKATLKSVITQAEQFIVRTDITNDKIDSTAWILADACVDFEIGVNASDIGLIDPLATKQTKYLYINLDKFAERFLIFGMHDATGYGVGWTGDDDRSDVKDVCGSYPAVYSEDFFQIARGQDQTRMHYRLSSAYERGGVITICWHQYDPQGRGFYSWDVNEERIVATILPGGQYHEFYKEKLSTVAYFLKTLRGKNGESVPVIFRPYHEHTGGWFWWGVGHCTTEEYNHIWRFTVEYLRDSLNVHNLIYALSPSLSHLNDEDDYFNIYPGDDYVDVMGTDHYLGNPPDKGTFTRKLKYVITGSEQREKVVALTEIGNENLVDHDFFTDVILNPILADTNLQKVSYAAVWRNQDTGHHFAPYPGHASVPDFIDFYNNSYTLFEDNLPDMYQLASLDETPPVVIEYPSEEYTAYETDVNIQVKTNERAFLRYSQSDQSYPEMLNEFQQGQGGFEHSTFFEGTQGESYHIYIRAADYNGNMMNESIVVNFTIDTLQRPVAWNEKYYDISEWQTGNGPFHFDNGTQDSTTVPYSRTVYMRKIFDVSNLDSLFQMVAFVQYDNGFVLYVNGNAVHRVNMPDGNVNYNTWAGTSTQSSTTITLNAADLAYMNNGKNVIAAEVHQYSDDSTDFKFDLKLIDPNVVVDYGSIWLVYSNGQEPPVKTVGATNISEQNHALPHNAALAQNYPNPFNPSTTIRFAVSKSGLVRLRVYDLTGRRVTELLNQKIQSGWHSLQFNGAGLVSGVYYYQLSTSQGTLVRKMLLIK